MKAPGPVTLRLALMLALPPLLWAGNAVVGRLAVGSVLPLRLNALRWALALLLLLPLGWRVLATAQARGQLRARWRYFALLGLTGVGAYNALQYLALVTSTPINVTLIAASGPMWMMSVGALFFGVRPRTQDVVGALLSLLGVAMVLSRGDPAGLLRVHFVAGDLLMMAATCSWAFYSWLLAKPPASMQAPQRPAWNWAEFLVAQMAVGLLWAGSAAAIEAAVMPALPPLGERWPWVLAALAYVAIGPSLLAYRVWGVAVSRAGPAVAAIFGNLTPLFAALMSAALLKEWPQPFHGLAFACIVAGIVVSSRRRT